MTDYIKSPLNYTGGKYKLLDTIIPAFPVSINRFVDLFAGGLNVGVNVDAKKIYANDQLSFLMDLYEYFRAIPTDAILKEIAIRIEGYALSSTNREGYNELRKEYNRSRQPIDLFVLLCFSFNHQIRFNKKYEFNTPFGKNRSVYNASIKANLIKFCKELKNKDIVMTSNDFGSFDFSGYGSGDFVYCDPPYLITTGSYNDGKRGFKDWTETEETELLSLLDDLSSKGVKFALSNVFQHKGETNDILIGWSEKYHVVFLEKSYANCSYHFKDRKTKTTEVLITNYNAPLD